MPGREGEYGPEAKLVGLCVRSEACLGCKPRSPYLPVDVGTLPACPMHLRRSTTIGPDVQFLADFRLPWALGGPVGKLCPSLFPPWTFGARDSLGGHTEWSTPLLFVHICPSCAPNNDLRAEQA